MFVIGRRVIDIKEVRELSPDIDMSRSASENKVEEVNTPHVYGFIDSVLRESAPVVCCIRFMQ